MSFAVIAELPLGTYRAHRGEEVLDEVPSPARLHGALLCAAAQGPRAVLDGDRLVPREEDARALRWLEDHPPDGLCVPAGVVNDDGVTAYRRLGLLPKEGKRWVDKTAGKVTGRGVAVAGPFAWTWAQRPGPDVEHALADLCPDVAHLGISESPARLAVGDVEPTHAVDLAADLFTGSGLDVDVATPGRSAALGAAHDEAQGRSPSVSADRHSSSEGELPPGVVRSHLAPTRYVSRRPAPTGAPWPTVVLLPLHERVDQDWKLRWCVAVHRAMIRLIGSGAPPVVTGEYPTGAPQPANRVALQLLDQHMPFEGNSGAAATLAVLVPPGVPAEELAVLQRAVASLRSIRGPGGRERVVVGAPVAVPGGEFWSPVRPGHARTWRTVPAAVPDSRPLRSGSWTFADAAAMSVALVWRDEIAGRGRGDQWYRALADGAAARGVTVTAAHPITSGDLSRFVHKVRPHAVVRPYVADLDLGGLAGERTAVAIGQSRHLGVGLLVPVDAPVRPS